MFSGPPKWTVLRRMGMVIHPDLCEAYSNSANRFRREASLQSGEIIIMSDCSADPDEDIRFVLAWGGKQIIC